MSLVEMINEFHQNISEQEIDRITRRMLKLSPQRIDELWRRVGVLQFIEADVTTSGEGEFKALTRDNMRWLLQSFGNARRLVKAFLSESDIQVVRKALDVLESEETN